MNWDDLLYPKRHSIHTDRNPPLIRELFTHEVVKEDAPANMNALAEDKLLFLCEYKTTMGPPNHFVKKKEPKWNNYRLLEKMSGYPKHSWNYELIHTNLGSWILILKLLYWIRYPILSVIKILCVYIGQLHMEGLPTLSWFKFPHLHSCFLGASLGNAK